MGQWNMTRLWGNVDLGHRTQLRSLGRGSMVIEDQNFDVVLLQC